MDIAEAVLVEPALSGAWTTTDDALDKLHQVIMDMRPTRDTWGTTEAAKAGAAAAEQVFGQAPPRT